MVVAKDFAPDDGMLDDPAAGRHGTNVSGIVVGVAPDAKILGLDVFNGQTSNASTQVSAINFAISNQATYNIRAINMSLGSGRRISRRPVRVPHSPGRPPSRTRGAGILPVVASGNDAFSNGAFHVGISVPACIPGALPVGAVYDSDVGGKTWGSGNDACSEPTTAADKITCFSQSWTGNQVLAPGAADHRGRHHAGWNLAGDTARRGGGSGPPRRRGSRPMPSVATVDQVLTALLNSGPQILDPLTNVNYRRLDLPAAVAALGTTPPPPTNCTIVGTVAAEVLGGTPGDDVYCGEGGAT